MSDDTPAPVEEQKRDDFLTRIIDQLLDLLQTARDWVRQEAEATIKEKVVPPLQKVGILIGAAIGAASMMVIGAILIAVAAVV